MKKITILALLFLASLSTLFAQSLSAPATVNNNEEFIISGSGESLTTYFTFASWDPTSIETITPDAFKQVYVSLTNVNFQSQYNIANQTPSKIKVKAINTFHQDIKVKFKFNTSVYNSSTGQTLFNQPKYITITIKPTTTPTQPSTYYNAAQSQSFTKNNCPSGQNGSIVIYSVPAGKYSSTVSQADANSKATTEINAQGQTYANNNGGCQLDIDQYVTIDGPITFVPNTGLVLWYNVVFTGPLANKTITNFSWTLPSTWNQEYSDSENIGFVPQTGGALAGSIIYQFEIDGVNYKKSLFVKGNRPPNPTTPTN